MSPRLHGLGMMALVVRNKVCQSQDLMLLTKILFLRTFHYNDYKTLLFPRSSHMIVHTQNGTPCYDFLTLIFQ